MNECISHLKMNSFVTSFRKLKETLITDDSLIEVTDFGAGSRVIKSNLRKVSAIAKNAGITKKNAMLIQNVITHYDVKNILEIGTSVGLGTYCLANNKNVKVTTLEGCNNTLNVAKKLLKNNGIDNVKFIQGDFDITLKKVIENNKYDLIYFDGNHQKEPTINYFEQCLASAHKDSIFIFDDIYWSKGMSEAWNYIKNHDQVTLSIDTFYWGIVFFRENEKKEHYKIKIT